MNPSFGRGRGRRLQLGNSSSNSSYLARYGYQSLSEDAVSTDRKEKSSQEKAGLSRLVGAYDDSDSESEPEDEPSQQPAQSCEPPPTLPPVPVAVETTPQSKNPGEGQAMDCEVANFLAEINAISSDNPAVDHNDIPLPPGAFIPRDQTAEVMAEKAVQRLQAEEAKVEPKPTKKTSSYSMFVKGGSEQLGDKKSYMSKFTKGGVEVLGLTAESKVVADVKDEEFELPEAPMSVWQQCQDENTKYVYYWNYVTNEVTWTIPMDYTQYLLLMKEYEDKLARIPEDVRKRLEAKKTASENQQSHQNGKKQEKEEVSDPVAIAPQLPPLTEQDSKSSSPSQIVGPQLPPARVDSPQPEDPEKLKSKLKKSKKTYGPVLPESMDVASTKPQKQEEEVSSKQNPNILEVDMFVSELLGGKDQTGGSSVLKKEGKKSEDKDSNHGNGVSLPKNGVKKEGGKEGEEEDFDIDDIDAALELALERKTAELKKLNRLETKDSKHSKSKKHDRRDRDRKKDKHRSDSHKSESRHKHDKSETRHKSESKQKRSSRHNSGEPEEKTFPAESQPKKARLVAAYDEDSEEEDASMKTPPTPAEPVKQESEEPTEEEQPKEVPVPHIVKVKDDVEDVANIALGKLEFLEVTKKGLSKLQVLLLELQTRFRDWQDGGLDTEYFLCRLREANRQLEQYEQSAVPAGFSCHWDRNFRRYFYTNEKNGESQWDYPEATPAAKSVPSSQSEVSSSNEPAIPDVAPPSPKPKPPPPPLPPDEDEPVLYGPQLPPTTTENVTPPNEEDNLANSIDGEPMAPDSSDEMPSEPPKPPELEPSEPSEPLKEDLPVFPGEPPPPGTEVLFGLPPPPPPSEPYPGDDDTSYSVDHDSPEEADMDVDDPETPASTDAEDCVTSSHPDYILPSIPVSSSSDISSVSQHSSEALESAPVIYRAPQLNVAASSSSISASSVITAASSLISASATAAAPSSVAAAPAVITSQPVTETVAPSSVPPSSLPIDMFASTPVSEEISSTSLAEPPAPLPAPPAQPEAEKGQKEKKKKKKDKSISSSSLSLKKKNVSSLVQKWQQVKVQVEEEEKVNEERQKAIRQKLEEWKREQAHS
ncbi:formin-binding protein 4-like [Haliotis rufescens]|uniref:formin-binding protein 4-like n=1 Tax=Haliotis rufescens TaxID=6454 RepID=UPI00201F79C0|nr:formin-binding protein 4-like [Haliotis rufescens]